MDPIFSPMLLEAASSAGEDLEYAVAFSEFMSLSTPRQEQQVGEHVIPAQPPPWGDVFKMGSSLLEKSRDLRVLTKVCWAALHKHGLPGLAQGLALMEQWIENDWDYLYPQIETDGDYDPLSRSNAIAEISDREGLVHSLLQTTFLETSIGSVTIHAAERVLEGKHEEGKSPVSSSEQLSRMLVTEKDNNQNQNRLAAISSISSSLASITSTFKVRIESEYWPNIDLLTKIIARLNRFVGEQLHEEDSSDSASVQAHENGATADTPKVSGPLPSSLNTRADAYKALALARGYFERHEPSHPAPLLIRRVERIGSSDFMAIIEELIPNATDFVRQLSGEG